MYPNPLTGNGYSLTELTQAINVLPNMYGRVTQMGLFTTRGLTQPTFTIEYRDGVLALVPTTPWGGPAPKNQMGKSRTIPFVVPHTPFEDLVKASEVMGIRAFGSETVAESVGSRVNDKLQVMKNKIDQTMEFRRMGALKGIVYDADGETVLVDYFQSFGITQQVMTWDLSRTNTTTFVRDMVISLARYMEDHAMGATFTGIHVLCSPEFFSALVSAPSVERIYAASLSLAQVAAQDLRKGWQFAGATFEEYRGVVNGNKFIEPGAAYAFPEGTTDMFSDMVAPADFLETVNTVGIPYYARQANQDMNRGIDLHVQSNILPMVTRPGLLVKLVAAD